MSRGPQERSSLPKWSLNRAMYGDDRNTAETRHRDAGEVGTGHIPVVMPVICDVT